MIAILKKYKIIMSIVITTLSIFLITTLFMGYPIVFDFSDSIDYHGTSYKKGDTIMPLNKFNFDEGDWIAYLFVNNNDNYLLPHELSNYSKFYSSDRMLLKKMQKEWIFNFSDGDMATIESSIIICNNGKKVFESSIALDSRLQGLQNSNYGWIVALDTNMLLNTVKHFRRAIFPIIILK